MPPNETTVLLTNYRETHIISSGRNGYGGNGRLLQTPTSHVVEVSKDPAEYEPIFEIENSSSALTLAELLPFQDDPWWQRLRRILFSAFWLILLMTFCTACLLAYLKSGQLPCSVASQQQLLLTEMISSTVPAAPAATWGSSIALPTITEILSPPQVLDTNGKIAPS